MAESGRAAIYDEDGILTYETVYQLYHQGPTPIRIIGTDFSILAHNPAMNRLCQVLDPQIIGKRCYEIAAAQGICHTDQCPVRMILAGEPQVEQYYDCELWNGRTFPASVTATPFYDGNGEIIGVVQVITDQSDLMAFSKSLEEKTRELEEHLRRMEGFYQVSRLFNEDHDIETMSHRLLELIPRFTPAVAGVIFLFDKVQGALVPVASRGLSRTPPPFDLGRGLPGMVAQERRPQFLHEVPPDYIALESGLMGPGPRHLACLPLVAADDLVGVMELCGLAPLEGSQEFLSNIAAQLAVAMQNSLYVEQLKEITRELEEKNEQLVAQNEELQAQSEELMAQSEELQAQAEELQAQRNALEQKSLEAEEANRMKSVFLSNMSHELRTPLNSIIGLVKLLKENPDEPLTEKQLQYMEIVLRNGQSLLELINDILDITRIEAGREEVRRDVVPLRELVEGIASNIRPLAEAKGLVFELSISPDLPTTMVSDQRKIKQILTNLLGNAIKFTEEGRVRLEAAPVREGEREMVAFSVEDTGIGIPQEALRFIFEPFRQVDGSYTRRYGGTGLGLSISRKLAELLGGRIEVESEVGKGSRFTLLLPLDRPGSGLSDDEEWKRRLVRALGLGESEAQGESQPGPVEPPPPREEEAVAGPVQGRVLVVDDDVVTVREMGNFLRRKGLMASFAFDGASGLAMAREQRPDLIFLDLKMPVLDGFAFLREMGKEPGLARTPVVILTAHDLDEEISQRLPSNVKGVLRKGEVMTGDLEALLADLLGRSPSPPAAPTRPGRKEGAAPAKEGPPTILVAEDNPDNTFLLRELLTNKGYRFLHAADGRQAVELARQEEPDLIIMDIQMPELDGMEATRAIRRAGLREVPVIALTAKAMKGDREQILAAGCDDYVAKPFEPRQLLDKIEHWLKKESGGGK